MDKNEIYMNIAKEVAKLSHCMSFQVGCVLVKDGRIISTGYNGTPVGYLNCDDIFSKETFDREKHHEFSETFELHAELNAILYAAKAGVAIDNSIMYTTLHPCNDCLKMICNSGIKTIYYKDEYDKFSDSKEIKKMLKICKVQLIKL